jgi:hypothetical protein
MWESNIIINNMANSLGSFPCFVSSQLFTCISKLGHVSPRIG